VQNSFRGRYQERLVAGSSNGIGDAVAVRPATFWASSFRVGLRGKKGLQSFAVGGMIVGDDDGELFLQDNGTPTYLTVSASATKHLLTPPLDIKC